MTREDLRKYLIEQGGLFPGCYLITRHGTTERYVGQSICIVDRIDEHIDKSDKASDGIDAAIKKYGWEAFDYEVLEAIPEATTDQLWYREAVLIEKFDSYNNGYNKTIGNKKHCQKIWSEITKYTDKHKVPKTVIKKLPITDNPKLLVHAFDKKYLDRLTYDDIKYININKDFTFTNNKGELKENSEALGEYIMAQLDNPIVLESLNQEIISNPPYGIGKNSGEEITYKIITEIPFTEFFNLEPGNDYFGPKKLYKYLDPSFKPIIYPAYSIPDAEQVLVLSKLQKKKNNLAEIEARIILHLSVEDINVYNALKEYILKVNINNTPLEFSLTKLTRRQTFVKYNPDLFMFNSGSFDIAHGYYAVMSKDRLNWTDAIRYNILKEDITTGSDIPAAIVNGCTNFKKIFISKLGLAFMRILFSALPEGWGLKNLFADINYSNCKNLIDVFNTIGLSAESQNILLSKIAQITLTDKELEICKLAETL